MLKKILLIILFLISISSIAYSFSEYALVVNSITQNYGKPLVKSYGGYFYGVRSFNNRFYLFKADSNFNIIWAREILYGFYAPSACVQDIYVDDTGIYISEVDSSPSIGRLLHFDLNGTFLWAKKLDNYNSEIDSNANVIPYGIDKLPNGTYILALNAYYNNVYGNKGGIINFDSNGNILSYKFNNTFADYRKPIFFNNKLYLLSVGGLTILDPNTLDVENSYHIGVRNYSGAMLNSGLTNFIIDPSGNFYLEFVDSNLVNYSALTDGASGRGLSPHPEDPQRDSCFNEG